MSFRSELIQVAAVAVAMVEDIDTGVAQVNQHTEDVLADVLQERMFQEDKWGTQTHDAQTWLAILMEEVGESAQAALNEVIFAS